MNIEARIKIQQDLFEAVQQVSRSKGKAYAGDEDTLANFKEVAALTGATKYQVWSVYFQKHVLAIMNAVKANPVAPVESTEGMDGRIMDAVTYLAILKCLLAEDKKSVEITHSVTTTGVDNVNPKRCLPDPKKRGIYQLGFLQESEDAVGEILNSWGVPLLNMNPLVISLATQFCCDLTLEGSRAIFVSRLREMAQVGFIWSEEEKKIVGIPAVQNESTDSCEEAAPKSEISLAGLVPEDDVEDTF